MRQTKTFLISVIYFIVFLIFFAQGKYIFAQSACDSSSCTDPDPTNHLNCVAGVLGNCEQQLQGVQNQEKTLKSQLSIINGQIQVTVLKVEETNLKIDKLKREISDLDTRIDRIGVTLDSLSEVLLKRIVQTYKSSSGITSIDLLFSSHGFADLIERLKYIQVAQAYDKKKLYELQATKLAYNDQKQDKQTRQTEAEKLNKDLETYQQQLDQQKKGKDELLRVTKNDEARYQALVAQLKADADSIARALSNVGVKIGPVNKGDVIAAEGLTGCTSGPHLHFEVYENAKIENSQVVDKNTGTPVHSPDDSSRIWNYLRNPHDFIDTGKLGPPMQGYPNYTHIATEFGQLYALGKHTGLDIYDDAFVGTPLLAADSGTAYAISGVGCPGLVVDGVNYDHGSGKGVVIDHGNGIVTLYWHIL